LIHSQRASCANITRIANTLAAPNIALQILRVCRSSAVAAYQGLLVMLCLTAFDPPTNINLCPTEILKFKTQSLLSHTVAVTVIWPDTASHILQHGSMSRKANMLQEV
jgi:hypothetical protein